MEPRTSPTAPTLGSSLTPTQRAKAREVATNFEAFYLTQFINLMKSKNEAEQFNGGFGEQMFRQELNTELGKALAKNGGFGLGDKVYTELLRQQEAAYGAR
ncbi:MAG: rod-binding protein [Alphaproteobacteria bacterium]|nr:rod-binding protein [Alphaproteobacteria bacterium]